MSEELVESRDDGVGFGFIVGGVENVWGGSRCLSRCSVGVWNAFGRLQVGFRDVTDIVGVPEKVLFMALSVLVFKLDRCLWGGSVHVSGGSKCSSGGSVRGWVGSVCVWGEGFVSLRLPYRYLRRFWDWRCSLSGFLSRWKTDCRSEDGNTDRAVSSWILTWEQGTGVKVWLCWQVLVFTCADVNPV